MYMAYILAEMERKEVVEKVVKISAIVLMNKIERKEMVAREVGRGFDILVPKKANDLMELMHKSIIKAPKWMLGFLLTDFIQVMYKNKKEEKIKLLEDLMANGAGVDPLPVLKLMRKWKQLKTEKLIILHDNRQGCLNVMYTYSCKQIVQLTTSGDFEELLASFV